MRTCEHCGADAVDARGVCATCGWQASRNPPLGGESSPSLGATRVASVDDYAPSRQGPQRSSARDDVARGEAGAIPPPLELRQSAPRQSPSALSRFCGACGARIGGDEVFCGQCGTPVGASSSSYGTLQGRPREGKEPYDSGLGETWMPGQHDQLTEAFSPAARGVYGPGGPDVLPYRPLGYERSQSNQVADQGDDSTRTVRIAAGIACLGMSLGSAVLAILLAR